MSLTEEPKTKFVEATETRRDDKQAKRGIMRTYLLICLGAVLLFSGYASMVLLQSSINIIGGLGAKVTAVNYGTSILFGIFVVPIVVRSMGTKKSLVLSECFFVAYVIANVYPAEWLLMIAAIMVGFSGATFWVPMGLLFSYFGRMYHKHSKKSEAACVREFSGIMFSIFQLNLVIGNIFISFVLHIFAPPASPSSTSDPSNSTGLATSTMVLSFTKAGIITNDYQHCGANDCQDPEKTEQHIDQYVPSNPVAMYVLILIFVVFMLSGCVLHLCFVPDVPMAFISGQIRYADEGKDEALEVIEVSPENQNNEQANKKSKVFKESWTAIKDMFIRFGDRRQILLYPINVYLGLQIGFLYSELTRAFASCIMGVSKIGTCAMLNAVANVTTSYGCGKIMARVGMLPVLVVTGVVELALLVLCAAWVPTAATSWLVYLVFIVCGSATASWNMVVANLYAETFQANRELSFTMWFIMFSVGFALQFAWSTLLCVREKIFIQMGVLVLGVLSVVFLRQRYKKLGV